MTRGLLLEGVMSEPTDPVDPRVCPICDVRRSDAFAEVAAAMTAQRAKFREFVSVRYGARVLVEKAERIAKVAGLRVRDKQALEREAIGLAAMAMRFVEDICDWKTTDNQP
jgi:hypothetical protein